MTALLRVDGLEVHFPLRGGMFPLRGGVGRPGGAVRAVDGVSFAVEAGRTLALVGESGCGKSTTAYAIVGLERATAGTVLFEGRDITAAAGRERAGLARAMQIVFQDPSAALDPRMAVADSIGEGLAIAGVPRSDRRRRVAALMDQVGLPAALAERRPAALSGGQRQRVVIARALSLSPRLLVLDEPVSALDVSIRSGILNLLGDIQREAGIAYLFISHDLSVVRHVADEVAVMYLGTVVERGPVEALFARPQHPYTQALLSAIPLPDPAAQRRRRRIVLAGDLPSPVAVPAGCPFATRCPVRVESCSAERPKLAPAPSGTDVACLLRP